MEEKSWKYWYGKTEELYQEVAEILLEQFQEIYKEIENAVNLSPDLTVKAKAINNSDIILTTKWKGTLANDICIKVKANNEFTITETKAAGALQNPLKCYETFNNVWYTMVVSPFLNKETVTKIGFVSGKRLDPLIDKPILNIFVCVDVF